MKRHIIILFLALFVVIPHASFSQDHQSVFHREPPRDFDEYVEGALKVYSQFQTPSKESSEDFYKFVKEKWNKTNCTVKCSEDGFKVAIEYVEKNKIQIKETKK